MVFVSDDSAGYIHPDLTGVKVLEFGVGGIIANVAAIADVGDMIGELEGKVFDSNGGVVVIEDSGDVDFL